MSFGVTPQGFVRKTQSEIQASLEAGWIGIFGSGVDLSPSTPDAQIIGLFSGALAEVWQAAEAAYFSYRPRQAMGTALSELVGFNGLTRLPGTKTFVSITFAVTGGPVAITTDFRIQSSAGDLFAKIGPSGTQGDGTVAVFGSVEEAPIVVPVGDDWKIVTPVARLTAVSNAAAPIQVGTYAESDAQLRARQIVSTENAAANILESLYAALLQVEGVLRVRIYVNDTSGVVDGRPAHSYEVVVEGGTDADVAAAIWSRHPAGIELFGSTTESIVDSQGFSQDIEFTRPTPVDIVVDVILAATADYPSTGDDDIAQALVDYANGVLVEGEGFGIGDDVRITRLYTPINSVPGHHVTALEIGDPTLGTVDISIDETEVARFTVGNVTVTS